MSGDPVDAALVERRLATLREEAARGAARLAEVEAEAERLRATLLRISGAIQVLTEVLGEEAGGAGAAVS